ncbi:YveK family protein [Kribbella sp. NPDC049227]|uniref:YveK family protein n=1 Tax=Kribbella sp. NPDC049227 TaxID=3364113 RepID=UPI0037149F13
MSNQPYNEPVVSQPAWTDDDGLFADDGPSTAYPPDALVTFRFLRDAVRRHLRIWLIIAIVGLAGGLASTVVVPTPNVSSTRLLLTHRDGEDPAKAMATDISLATTHTVAQRVIDLLKLPETQDDLLKEYTAGAKTDRVLEITASAKTPEQATKLATVVAQVFLVYRKEQIALQDAPLRRDKAAADSDLAVAEQAVRAAGDDPDELKSPTSQEAVRLGAARDRVQYVGQQLLDQQVQASRMNSSRMLDAAAPVPVSAKRTIAINAATGLLAGLFIGLGFVIVRALISDRLWKRQDIARALGARVRLSSERPPRWRLLPYPRYLSDSQRRQPEVRLMVQHLDQRIFWGERPTPAMAVVSVDDVKTCALVVASLAVALAEEGKHVLVADLTETGRLAGMLGVKTPGTHESRFSEPGRRIDVHRPDPDRGPAQGCYLRLSDSNRPASSGDIALDSAWEVSDLVLTLTTLTPEIGADHLGTWASHAAVVVTAGQSTTTKIQATGEMLRLAGLELDTAVVLRPDSTDEGVGVAEAEAGTPRTVDVEMFGR